MRWPEDFEQRFSVNTQLVVCHVSVIYWSNILLFAKTLHSCFQNDFKCITVLGPQAGW